MYIKMIFKREGWNVPGCNAGFFDVLFGSPKMADKLPAGVQADHFNPVQSQFHAKTPDTFCYYLNCGAMTEREIKQAIGLFTDHYNVHGSSLPAVLSNPHVDGNELITNMKIALANIFIAQDKRNPYLSECNMSQADDMVRVLNR